MRPRASAAWLAVLATIFVLIVTAAMVAIAKLPAPGLESLLTLLVGQLGTLGWLALAVTVIWHLWEPFHRELLPRMTSVKWAGVELGLAKKSIEQAIVTTQSRDVIIRKTVEEVQVQISDVDRTRALARAGRCIEVMRSKRILWIDDEISNNWYERRMLAAYSLDIEQVTSTENALKELFHPDHQYDLVISDIERPESKQAGLDFVKRYQARDGALPVIIYITRLESERPTPVGAFGITNRPDILLHLVIDALERSPGSP